MTINKIRVILKLKLNLLEIWEKYNTNNYTNSL